MQQFVIKIALLAFTAAGAAAPLSAEQPLKQEEATPFTSFTGQVTKSHVRVRLNPNLDSPIIREVEAGEMVVIEGEEEDFYAIRAPEDLKAYIFRTYILDGVIEGNHVNMRLEPTLEGHVIGQLNSGDRVEGKVSPVNSKWLEVAAPSSTRLYISKDFIKKIGDADYIVKYRRRMDEVNQLLSGAYLNSESSLKGNFRTIDEEAIVRQFEAIINDYPDFDEQASQARELLAAFQDNFMKKKITYLEEAASQSSNNEDLRRQNSRLAQAVNDQHNRLQQLESHLNSDYPGSSGTMLIWLPVEDKLYTAWADDNDGGTLEDFYAAERDDAVTLRGVIEPYSRSIKNKPGDYILLNGNGIPVAYIYSTHVNLQELVGHEKTLVAVKRPNNNFAFPAYFILEAQD